MKPVYQIKEYGSFITGKKIEGYITLPPHIFEQLETFILTNRSKDTDALELMGLSARKGIGKVITAKNYVGIITLSDGTTIEILPKIFSAVEDDAAGTKTKRLLVEMLKTLRDSPYKSLQTSSVNIEKMNIFEVFIRMFVDEVFFIVKRGLKCSYETIEENTTFFKGKMKFSQQIKAHLQKENLGGIIAYNVKTQNMPLFRILPCKVKCGLMRLAYRFFGESNSSLTMTNLGNLTLPQVMVPHVESVILTMTNLGSIALPEGMIPYVDSLILTMMPRVRSPYNCGMYSYNGNFFINLCRFPEKSDLEEIFVRKLHDALHGKEQSV